MHAEEQKVTLRESVNSSWYLMKPCSDSNAKWNVDFRPLPVLLSLLVFSFCLTVFFASPVTTSTDSRWSIHTAMSFANGKGGDLSEYLPIIASERSYGIEYPDGRPHTSYPIGASLLALPTVVIIATFDRDWVQNLRDKIPDKTEKYIASMIGAAAAVMFFWIIFLQFQSLSLALFSTMVFSFSTPMWSTATRALWQHGPLVLMLNIAIFILIRARQQPSLVKFAAIPLAMAYLIRPTAVVPISVFSLYVLLYYRQFFLKYVGWALVIGVPWIAYNVSLYHWILPPYYTSNAFSEGTHFVEGILGNLFSPSRGLLVFSPVLIFSINGFVLALRQPEQRPLHVAFGAVVALHTILIGFASMWWAGHSFGPRFMTDIIPFLVYFIPFNFSPDAMPYPGVRKALSVAIIGCAVISAAIHGNGALRTAPWLWNVQPNNIDDIAQRAWDWGDPQFLR